MSFDVSILVITYNHEEFITDALTGICQQNLGDLSVEIVVTDDCSTDNTAGFVRSMDVENQTLRLFVNAKNEGPMRNLTNGLRKCRGRYIALCEGDDFWIDPNKLLKQMAVMAREPGVAASYSSVTIVDREGREVGTRNIRKRELRQTDVLRGVIPPTATVLFRRDCIKEKDLEILNRVQYGDRLLLALVTRFGIARSVEGPHAAYRVHAGGLFSMQNEVFRAQKALQTYRVMYEVFEKRSQRKAIAIGASDKFSFLIVNALVLTGDCGFRQIMKEWYALAGAKQLALIMLHAGKTIVIRALRGRL
ncbi:glycosyltransferase [bacterium]|nr:glycosyltransferase [bacterium]